MLGGVIMQKSDLSDLFSLKGKTAVITGASGDLGIAMSTALAKSGANIVAAGRNEDKLNEKIKHITKLGNAIAVPTDVRDRKQVEFLMNTTMEKFGSLDILITAAGIQIRNSALNFTDEDWNNVIGVNLTGTFICCQEAAKYMIPQKSGVIITISSLTAEIGIPNMVAYVASRGGIRQLTKALAVEWANLGIRVNSIGPGRFKTNMTEDIFDDNSTREKFLSCIPFGRAGVPTDIEGVTLFLASNASKYMTGQCIYLDGGWLAAGGNANY